MAETKKSSSSKRSTSGTRKKSSSGGGSSKSSAQKSSSGGGSSSKSSSSSGGGGSKSSKGATARDIIGAAAEQLPELIGRPIEAVLGIEKDGNEWSVSVEVIELERVPNTTDILGKYDVTLDGDGDVIAARRTRRYLRSQSGED